MALTACAYPLSAAEALYNINDGYGDCRFLYHI